MRIISRKKGKKNYFYLQHSFRKNGKIKTLERYLGATTKNYEKMKKEILTIQNQELFNKFERIKSNFQKKWKKLPKSIKEKKLNQLATSFTYNTNAIEGSKITLPETRELFEKNISPNKSLNDVKESEAHHKLFFEILKSKEKISIKLLKKWHYKLFKNTKPDIAGKFRNYLIRVDEYVAPDWQDVNKLMKNFVKFPDIHPIELVARLHYKFEKIHPFGDGNGRIGRLLINYILWHNKYPMIIIEYKNQKSYYNAFRDEEKFVLYFFKRYLKTHKKLL